MNSKEQKLRKIIREELKTQLSEAKKSYKIPDEFSYEPREAVFIKKLKPIADQYGLTDILFTLWQLYSDWGENQSAKYTEKLFKKTIKEF